MPMQAVFVNTDKPFKEINRLGVFKYIESFNGVKTFFELCEVFYDHPNAPGRATVSIFEWKRITLNFGTENLIKFSIDSMKDIQKITTLS